MIDDSIELVPISESRFRYGEFPVELWFEGDKHGGSPRVTVHAPLQKPANYEFAPPFEPDANEMQEYVGTYYSDEVETRYLVSIESRNLVLSSIKVRSVALRPVIRDVFGGWFGRIRFTRNEQGAISGIRFNSSRIRHFWLTKIA